MAMTGMISFKQFLVEKALNPSTFAATLERLSDKALLGFEIEVWVNRQSNLFAGDVPTNTPFTNLAKIIELDDWRDLFEIDREVRGDIMDEFNDWKEAAGSNAKWSDYFDYTFGYGTKAGMDFVKTYDIEPKYGWKEEGVSVYSEIHDESSDTHVPWRPVGENVAVELGDALGRKVSVGYSGNVNDWVVTEDGSIEGPGPGCGIEIVSPPQNIADAMDDLQNCFRFIKNNDLITNNTTGLHINLSLPDLKRLLDPLKLVMFIGEDHILKEFNRTGNTYTKTHKADILASIEENGVPPKDSSLVRLATKVLKQEKYRTINLSKLAAGYLEFRAAGNDGYERDWKKIQDTIGRFLTVLELACDPTAERKLYLKKVARMFGDATAAHAPTDDSLRTLTVKLRNTIILDQLNDLLSEENISYTLASRLFGAMMSDIGEHMRLKGYNPTDGVIAQFKFLYNKFLKRLPNLPQKIDDELFDTPRQDVEIFKKAFRVK